MPQGLQPKDPRATMIPGAIPGPYQNAQAYGAKGLAGTPLMAQAQPTAKKNMPPVGVPSGAGAAPAGGASLAQPIGNPFAAAAPSAAGVQGVPGAAASPVAGVSPVPGAVGGIGPTSAAAPAPASPGIQPPKYPVQPGVKGGGATGAAPVGAAPVGGATPVTGAPPTPGGQGGVPVGAAPVGAAPAGGAAPVPGYSTGGSANPTTPKTTTPFNDILTQQFGAGNPFAPNPMFNDPLHAAEDRANYMLNQQLAGLRERFGAGGLGDSSRSALAQGSAIGEASTGLGQILGQMGLTQNQADRDRALQALLGAGQQDLATQQLPIQALQALGQLGGGLLGQVNAEQMPQLLSAILPILTNFANQNTNSRTGTRT